MKPYTYVSLFSSAGVGCFGFKEEKFDCVLTNELVERRMEVQKCNAKCSDPRSYLCGNINDPEIQKYALNYINEYKKNNLFGLFFVLCDGFCTKCSLKQRCKNS